MNYHTKESRDSDWEYCSDDSRHTTNGYRCHDACETRGHGYFWCHTEDRRWDYCSPDPTMDEVLNEEVQLTRYGVKCRDKCDQKGYDYSWCKVYVASPYYPDFINFWDYCSTDPNMTSHQNICKNDCEKHGESYHWCQTQDSWDYCSPEFQVGVVGKEYKRFSVVINSQKMLTSLIFLFSNNL